MSLFKVALTVTFALAAARRTVDATPSDTVPLVSLLVTNVHLPHLIPRLIDIAARQSYPNIELVIFDDSPGACWVQIGVTLQIFLSLYSTYA